MGYTLPQIAVILAKADRTMYKIGAIAYDDMFNQLDESLDYDRDIIYIYKVAVEYADNFYVGTDKLDTVVERLGAKVAVYDFGQLTPIYSDSTIVTQVVPVGAALNDLSDVTITNLQDQQTLKYNAALGQWVNVGTGNAVRNTQQFTATSGQTTFTTAYQFDGGLVDIFVNGVKLSTPSYTVFGNYTIILTDGCVSGDIVEIVAYENNIAFIDLSAYYVPVGRTITINGVTYDLSANRSWTTVSSVGISMPSAFTVSNSPVTTSGTLTVTGAGTTAQYIRGDGSLATFPALTGYVPYTGASGDVNLGEFELKAGQVEFDQTPTGAAGIAVMRWNDTDGTVDLGLKGGNVTLQMGQELVQRVVNKSGASLLESAYQVVKVITAQGQRLAIDLAQGNNDANSADTLGIVTETISNNQEGFITTSGLVRNINTTGSLQGETWADGDVLYLSPTVPGAITKVKPIAPNHSVILGYVVYAHANNGKIFVKVDNGYEIGELHDVNTTGAVNGNVLKYNGTIWIPSSDTGITSLNGLTALSQTFATGISGTDFGISSSTSTHTFNLPIASGTNTGKLSNTDWSIFNSKQNAITLTTTGTSGASTFISNTLNVPTYTLSGLGGVPTSRTLTINGTAFDLSADRTFSVGTVTSVAALTLGTTGTDLSSTVANGTTTPVITLNVPTASATNRGALSSADWTIFNNKVGGSGTINYLPKFTSASTIGNSLIYESSGVVNVGGQINITTGQALTLGFQNLQLPTGVASTISAGLSVRTGVANESIIQFGNNLNAYYTGLVDASRAGAMIRLDTRGVAPIPGASSYSVFQIQTRAAGVADPNYTVPVQIAAAPSGSFCIDINGYGYFYNRLRIGNTTTAPTEALSVTGNGVFSSNVTAASLIKSGGTSSQYLMADGSTSTLTNPVTGTGTTNYLPKFTGASTIGNSQIFDNGTSVGIGTTTFDIFGRFDDSYLTFSKAGNIALNINAGTASTRGAQIYMGQGGARYFTITSNVVESTIGTINNSPLIFGSNNTERARFSDTGNLLVGTTTDNGNRLQITGNVYLGGDVGIGNSSPSGALHVSTFGKYSYFSSNADGAYPANIQGISFGWNLSGGSGETIIAYNKGGGSTGGLVFANNDGGSYNERMRLTSSGNLGLGVTPSAWGSNWKALEMSNGVYLTALSASTVPIMILGANAYFDNTNFIYKTTAAASRYQQDSGIHYWYTAPSGTAGNAITFTQAMTLTANGRLLLGTTTEGSELLQVNGDGSFKVASGNVGYSFVSGSDAFSFYFNDADNSYRIYTGIGTPGDRFILSSTGAATFSSSVSGLSFAAASSGTEQAILQGGFLQFYNAAASPKYIKLTDDLSTINAIQFSKSGSSATISFPSSGNLLVGTTTDSGERLQVSGDILSKAATGNTAKVSLTSGIFNSYISAVDGNRNMVFVNTSTINLGDNISDIRFCTNNNTTTPALKLAITGAAAFSSDVTVSGVLQETVTTNRQTASYTLALTDRGKLVEMNVATANNLTVPLNSSVAFAIGTKIDLAQYGAGQTTVVATGGVTVRSAGGALKLALQYSGASLVKIGTNEWYLFGDITV